MTLNSPFTFSINDRSKWLVALALSLALVACGGGGKKGGNRAIVDDQTDTDQTSTGESGDLNGRWKVSYTMGPNSCGLEEKTLHIELDATLSGNKLVFHDDKGDVFIEGTLSGNTLTELEEDADDEYIYPSKTTYVFDETTFTGEETYTCQPKAGGNAGSGKAQYTGTKTSDSVPTNPGTPTNPDTPPQGGTASDDEPNNSVGQDNQLSVGDEVQGTVNNATDDVDLYSMTTSSSASYEVSLSNFGGNNLDLAVFQVVGTEMQVLDVSESGPGIEEFITLSGKDATQSKVYILVFANDTAATTSDYSLQVARP